MARLSFKAKVETVYHVDSSVAWQEVRVPVLKRRHCDMAGFRNHSVYGGLANSDLFEAGVLGRIRRDRLGEAIRLNKTPLGVTIDTSGFLAVVTVEV